MESKRFDDLTRNLAIGHTRRRVLKGMAAGVLTGLAAAFGRSGPDALAQDIKPDCRSDAECARRGLVNHVCDYNNFGRISCTCPSGWAPCSPTLCCPPSDTSPSGSTCPPDGEMTCIGMEPAGNGAEVPDSVNLPDEAQVPANPGPPAGLDLPENAGPPEDRGKPEKPGKKK